MNWLLGLAIAMVIAGTIAVASRPKPRHHPAWCHMIVFQEWNGRVWTHMLGLPCMYRTNDPVAV